jgi:hypothetical protein
MKQKFLVQVALAALFLTSIGPRPAQAWGEHRETRSCGAYWVTSYRAPAYSYAETRQTYGSCEGHAWAWIRKADGGFVGRAGTRDLGFVKLVVPGSVGAFHRGCDCASQALWWT